MQYPRQNTKVTPKTVLTAVVADLQTEGETDLIRWLTRADNWVLMQQYAQNLLESLPESAPAVAPIRDSTQVPLKRGELRLSEKGAVLARATHNVFRGERSTSYFGGWWWCMWPSLVDAARSGMQNPGIRYNQSTLTIAPFQPAWGGLSSAALSRGFQISPNSINAISRESEDALIRTGLFTRDITQGWTIVESYGDKTLPAPDWDVAPMAQSIDFLLSSWNFPHMIPIDTWVVRTGSPALGALVRLPEITGDGWLVRSSPTAPLDLLSYDQINNDRYWNIDLVLRNLRDFISPLRGTVYSAEPFINPLVKLSDVTNNPKLAIEAMLRAIYPDQKIKVGIRKEKKRGLADTPYGKGSDSQASVNIEFMGEYSRADRPKLFPPKPEFAYLALTAGAVGNRSPLLEEVRIPLILVREVGSSVCNNNAKYSIIEGYALDWLLSQRPATLVQPTFAIECVRKAQSRGLAVYLFGGVRAVHTPGDPTEYSVHWNFMYQTPEGGCILLEVEDLSIQMDAMYGLSKDPQMDVIMATAYRALSPWVTEDVGMRLRPLENMPKPSPVTPRPPNPTEQKKEKRPTYQKAMDEIFRAFGQLGWKQSNPNLAVRHVTYGNYRVYLKAQSLYYEKGGPPWRLGDAHSLHIGDVRDITDYVRFVDSISERIEGF